MNLPRIDVESNGNVRVIGGDYDLNRMLSALVSVINAQNHRVAELETRLAWASHLTDNRRRQMLVNLRVAMVDRLSLTEVRECMIDLGYRPDNYTGGLREIAGSFLNDAETRGNAPGGVSDILDWLQRERPDIIL